MSDSGFLSHVVTVNGTARRFVVYVPTSAQPNAGWPTILFLHGRGESGSDGLLQLVNGLMPAICRKTADWPFLVVFPQKLEQDGEWFDEKPMLEQVLKYVEQHWLSNPKQRYLTGLSQGGRGAIRLAAHLPWRFAAIAALCGWANPEVAVKELANTPLWLMHGEKDPVIASSESVAVYEAMKHLNPQAKLTLFPELTHNCWDEGYQRQELAKWFLGHSLP